MLALAISMEKDANTSKIQKQKKSSSNIFVSDNAKSNFMMTLHPKLILIFFFSMLSTTLGIVFKRLQLCTKNYLLLLMLFLFILAALVFCS